LIHISSILSTIGLPCKWNWLHQKWNQQCLLSWKKPEKVLEYDIQTVAYILEWYVKSPCLWALVWHSNPCLVPDSNVLCVQFSYWLLILSPVAKLGASSPSLGFFTDKSIVEKLAELAGPTDFAFLEHLQWCSPYVTLHKYFSHPSLVIHFFSTPLMKLKLGQGTAKRWGTTISKPNHLDESVWWANQKHWATVRSYWLHSFMQVNNVAAHFTSRRKLSNQRERKPFS
jgi:hypothetical protein